MYILSGIALLLVLAVCLWLYLTIDDWSRDLATNVAATSANAGNLSLRPIESDQQPIKLAELVCTAAGGIPGWEFLSQEESADEITLHFVRTTRWMRFKDDITVHIRPIHAERQSPHCQVSAESKSRIGKGDLGQNPRNLAELMDRLRTLLQ